MDDNDLSRRDLLRLARSGQDEGESEPDQDVGWKPGWDPVSEAERRRHRQEVRDQLGKISEPRERPVDVLEFLSSVKAPNEGGAEDSPTPASTGKGTIYVLRPPRALPEEDFLQACTRCGACGEACPHDAIEVAGPRFRGAQGTPMINPRRQPCLMCSDTPCVSACEPGALLYSLGLKMGTAQIQRHDCLAHQGSFCTTCSERCPVPGAIKVRDGKPEIRQAGCTGCGVCQHVCPAPINAVRIFPRKPPEVAR